MMAASKESHQPFVVAAIDFGTTFSSWAYQFANDYKRDPLKIYSKNWVNDIYISPKAPTTVLIKPDGKTFEAFGYKAEDKYAELADNDEHEAWFYFRRFKMKLFEAKKICLDMTIEAENGKELPALSIFSLVIGHLKNDLMEECSKTIVGGVKDSDVLWVLTVPAIWNDGAKQFMREAAIKAGVLSDKLIIALEPEAASVYCKQVSLDKQSGLEGSSVDTFSPGTKYLVLDAGGGTIDINVHEVLQDGNLKELHKPTGSNWGGTKVDEAFHQFFTELFGQSVMEQFQRDHMDDYLSLFRSFEVKKRETCKGDEAMTIFPLPSTLLDLLKEYTGQDVTAVLSSSQFGDSVVLRKGNKLKISASVMHSFYTDSISKIATQVQSILENTHVRDCQTILMVGGYSEARLLREEIKQTFPKMNVVTPNESSLVVLKGAVLYGRNPQVITSRVCKYTYGIGVQDYYDPNVHPESRIFVNKDGVKKVENIFLKVVEVGQEVLPHQAYGTGYVHSPPTKDATAGNCPLYASPNTDPKYIDEPGCFRVGDIWVDFRDKDGMIADAKLEFMFGGTEVVIKTVLLTTGEETVHTIRLPD